MIQSLVAPQTTEGRDDSGSSLPRIMNNEPIVIKNKIYIIEDKYPGKPQFKNDLLLKQDEIFIGGVDEDRIDDQASGSITFEKNRRSHLIQEAIRVPSTSHSLEAVERNGIFVQENSRQRSINEMSNNSSSNRGGGGGAGSDSNGSSRFKDSLRVKVSKIMPTYLGTKATLDAIVKPNKK